MKVDKIKLLKKTAVSIITYSLVFIIIYASFQYFSSLKIYDWNYHFIAYFVPLSSSIISTFFVEKYEKHPISMKSMFSTVFVILLMSPLVFGIALIFQGLGIFVYCILIYYFNLRVHEKFSSYFESRKED